MWLTWAVYNSEYLMGKSPTIPQAEFPFWEKQARTLINRRHVKFDSLADYEELTAAVALIKRLSDERVDVLSDVAEEIAEFINDELIAAGLEVSIEIIDDTLTITSGGLSDTYEFEIDYISVPGEVFIVNLVRIDREYNLPPYPVQMCIAEVGEWLFVQDQAPRAGELSSESNAGYSWHKIEAKSQVESEKQIQKIVMKWLASTPYHCDFVFIGNGLN